MIPQRKLNLRPLAGAAVLGVAIILAFVFFVGSLRQAATFAECPARSWSPGMGLDSFQNGTWYDEAGNVTGYGSDDEGYEVYSKPECVQK